MFTATKCNSGFKLRMDRPKKLDLMNIEVPFEVLARTPGMLILSVDNIQVNVYKNGDLLVRAEEPEAAAEKVAPFLE